MSTVTIPKKEYEKLKSQALAYKKMTKNLFSAVIQDPISEVVADFKKVGLYTPSFLKDLGDGLRKSSYVKRKK